MRVKRKFLQLTKRTYPYKTERQLLGYLPIGYQRDDYGNYFIQIGDNPTSMFTCHLDTACSNQSIVRHTFQGNYIGTDGRTILGADDKAGMTVVLYMIENNVPGLYYFFIGEEVGCVGSSASAENWKTKNIKRCISFDRRGTDSVITHQFWGRCCSDAFAIALSEQFNKVEPNFNFKPDSTGILTDSAQYTPIISECTNISVGYYQEHTSQEHQDIQHLIRLCKAVVGVDWEGLPTERVPGIFNEEEEELFCTAGGSGVRRVNNSPSKGRKALWLYLEEEQSVVECYLTDKRLEEEKAMIYQWILPQDSYSGMTGLSWNGSEAYAWYDDEKEYLAGRSALVSVCPEIGDVKSKDCDINFSYAGQH